jgi:hypothetical protein
MSKLIAREPTEEMLNRLWLELGDHPSRQHALEAFQAMWDAAPQVDGVPNTALAIELARIAHNHVEDGKMRHDVGLALEAAVRRFAAAPQPSSQSTAAQEPFCPTCRGNDADMPCAYPSAGKQGCLRDKRLAEQEQEKDALSDSQIACVGFDAFRILQGKQPRTYTAKRIADAILAAAHPQPAAQCVACGDTGIDPLSGTRCVPAAQEVIEYDGYDIDQGTPPWPFAAQEQEKDAMVLRAARALSDRSAEACNVNKEDNWAIYGDDFISDARAAIDAALSAHTNEGAHD